MIPPDSPTSQRALAVLALLCVLASFFFLLGRAPLFDVDEGAFSQATLEMFQRGDFLSTYLNGSPRYDKPILVYWLQAAAVAGLGTSELAFRLPSALCASLWALLTFLFARRYFGVQRGAPRGGDAGDVAGRVYHRARGDGRRAAQSADRGIHVRCLAAPRHGQRSWLYATFAAIGLGFLAKGPVAILVPLAVTFLFCILRRDLRTWARAVFDWRGLLLFAVIAVPWYAVIFVKEGTAFFAGFFLRHNLDRFGGPLQGHGGSLVYYFPIVLAWTLPFTALLVPVVRRLRAIWRDDLQLYLLLWFGFVFVFFSLSGTKLPHYVLYGITGLVLLMAAYAHELRSRFWALAPAVVFFLVLLLLPSTVQLAIPHVPDAYYREALSNADAYFTPWYFAFVGAALLVTVVAMLERRVPLAHKLARHRNPRRPRALGVRRAGGSGAAAGPDQGGGAAVRVSEISRPSCGGSTHPASACTAASRPRTASCAPATSSSRARSSCPSFPATATTCCTRRTVSRWSGFARDPGRTHGLLRALACGVGGAAGGLGRVRAGGRVWRESAVVPAAQRPGSRDGRRGVGEHHGAGRHRRRLGVVPAAVAAAAGSAMGAGAGRAARHRLGPWPEAVARDRPSARRAGGCRARHRPDPCLTLVPVGPRDHRLPRGRPARPRFRLAPRVRAASCWWR